MKVNDHWSVSQYPISKMYVAYGGPECHYRNVNIYW